MPQFPWGDDHWASAAGFCIDAGLLSQHALAPLEFGQLSQSFKPMIYSLFDQPAPPDVLVVHKGLLGHYDFDLLFAFRRAGDYVYGNSVFVILTRNLPHKQEGPSEHITVLDRYIENGTSESAGSQADNTWFFDRWQRHEPRPDLPIGDGKRIAIVSANRMGNFGDDLLTLATRNILLRAIEGSTVRVLAPPVEKEALTSIDCLVIGAGGLLYDGSLENVVNYMQPVALAAKAATKTICLGQGVQGISTPLGRDIFRRALSTCAGANHPRRGEHARADRRGGCDLRRPYSAGPRLFARPTHGRDCRKNAAPGSAHETARAGFALRSAASWRDKIGRIRRGSRRASAT